MFELAIANLRANKGRFVATVVAIVVGVMFLSAGLIFTDAIKSGLGGSLAERYANVDASLADNQDRQGPPTKLPNSLVEAAAQVDGVQAVAGELEGSVGLFVSGRTKPESLTARLWIPVASLNPTQVSSGRAPKVSGEVTLDRRTAADQKVSVGDRVELATSGGRQPFIVVGLSKFGDDDSQDNDGTVSFTEADAFNSINGGPHEYTRILVSGADGVSEATLVKRLRGVATDGVEVRTRAEFLDDVQGALAQIATVLKPVLTGFSLLALFVCGFVVTNTFAVVVAQRTRELALLRAIGATPRQVKRSVRAEALLVGIVSSVIGIAAGFGLVLAGVGILNANGVRLAGAGAKLTLGTIAFCLAVGTVVTVAAVWGASRRASRIAPVEAMRSGVVDAPTGIKGLINRVAILAIGIVVLIVGASTKNGYVLGVGALIFIVSVLRAGRVLAVGGARLARPLLRRLGPPGRLAGDNIQRNPKRAASTANALVIGVLLITLVTTAGGTLRSSLVSQLDGLSSADLQLTTEGAGFPEGLVDQIRKVNGVDTVAEVRISGATVDGEQTLMSTGTPKPLQRAAGVTVLAGSFDRLTDAGIAVIDFAGAGGGPGPRNPVVHKLGDRIKVSSLGGVERTQTVQVVIKFNLDAIFLSNLVTPATFQQLFGDRPASHAFVKVSGVEIRTVKASIERLTDNYATVEVQEGNFIGQVVDQALGYVINGVNGLLAMSVIIAVIGVINTMTLAVIERRREIGLLRAVGMLPGEARAMVGLEAVLIAVIGTIIGMLSGAFLGFWLTRSLDKVNGFTLELPKLALVLGIGIVVGFLSSLLPARRVGKMDVLDALQE